MELVSTGNEGRAGMAAIIVRRNCTFDGKRLFDYALKHLPAYARPLFIRIQVSLDAFLKHVLV